MIFFLLQHQCFSARMKAISPPKTIIAGNDLAVSVKALQLLIKGCQCKEAAAPLTGLRPHDQ